MTASLFYNRVQYTAVSAGTGDFVTSVATTGYRTPADASIPNGTLVSYVAFNAAQTEWETGQGAYTSGTLTVARTTIRESSNGGSKVNFTSAPTVAIDFQAQDFALLAPLISPSFTTPTLGVAIGTSLALGGATIGTNALAVTGTAIVSGGIKDSTAATGFTWDGSQLRVFTGTTERESLDANGHRLVSSYYFGWTNSTTNPENTPDTTLSRNAAGIVQFGTTAANAAGSWLATNGTLSGSLTIGAAVIDATGSKARTATWDATGAPGYTWYNTSTLGFQVNSGIQLGSGVGYSWTSGNANGTVDTTLSRNAAGVTQFGTTAANALGSWLAVNGTLSGALVVSGTADASAVTGSGALQVAGGGSVAKRFWLPAITTSAGLQTAVLCQSSGGEVIADSVACLASSERFKTILGSAETGAIDKINRVSIHRWKYKEEGIFQSENWTREHIGPTAEEIEAIDSRLVGYDSEGKARNISQEQLLALAIQAIQELNGKVDELKARAA